jgi:hypothetical protein
MEISGAIYSIEFYKSLSKFGGDSLFLQRSPQIIKPNMGRKNKRLINAKIVQHQSNLMAGPSGMA